jgi:hypothetical protein
MFSRKIIFKKRYDDMKEELKEKLRPLLQPGCLFYTGGKGFISKVVIYGQGRLDKTWTNAISHVMFVGNDGCIHESCITVGKNFKTGKKAYVSGVHIRPIEQWLNEAGKEDFAFTLVQKLDNITDEQIAKICEKSKSLKAKNMGYPVKELIGTLFASWNYNFAGLFKKINPKGVSKWQAKILSKENPLNNDNAMYCIAFAAHCFSAGGINILPDGINETVCKVGDGLKRKQLGYKLFFIKPPFVDYVKEPGKDFDFNL